MSSRSICVISPAVNMSSLPTVSRKIRARACYVVIISCYGPTYLDTERPDCLEASACNLPPFSLAGNTWIVARQLGNIIPRLVSHPQISFDTGPESSRPWVPSIALAECWPDWPTQFADSFLIAEPSEWLLRRVRTALERQPRLPWSSSFWS